MNRYIIGITNYECAASPRGVTVYQNNTNTVREVFADEENFRSTIKYGIPSEISDLLDKLTKNEDPRFTEEIYDVFQKNYYFHLWCQKS